MIQRSRSSGVYVFYPRIAAPKSGMDDLDWVPASGFGTVYSTTAVFAKPPAANYNVSLIDLDEGPRLMSCVVDIQPEEVRIGMRVSKRIEFLNGEARLVFVPHQNQL